MYFICLTLYGLILNILFYLNKLLPFFRQTGKITEVVMPLLWFAEVCAMVLIIKIMNLEESLNATALS